MYVLSSFTTWIKLFCILNELGVKYHFLYALIYTSRSVSPLALTSTEKPVKCVALHNTGGLGSLSCMMPSLDHPPVL